MMLRAVTFTEELVKEFVLRVPFLTIVTAFMVRNILLDYENGKTYEFVIEELKTTQSDILGNAIYFGFEPNNNHAMNFTNETYFSFKRLLKL